MIKDNKKILEDFKAIVKNANGKIISERLRESYFIKIDKHQLYLEWIDITATLRTVYDKPSHLILAADESLDIPLCEYCKVNPKKIVNDENDGYKRVISRYCSVRCSAKSPDKVKKFKEAWISKSDEDKQIQKDRREVTMIERYGVAYNLQRKDVRDKLNKICVIDECFLNLLTDKEWVHEQYFVQKKSLSMIAYELSEKFNKQIWYGTIGDYVKKLGYDIHYESKNSVEQQMVENFLIELGVNYIKNDVSLLKPRHVDFYLPEHNLAIEVDGIWWHTELFGADINYHIGKTIGCENKGIKLLHFTDIEIYKQYNVVKSIIRNAIGLSHKIYARKCELKSISHKDSIKFLKENHIQKSVTEDTAYGLFYNDELVSVMSFGKSRYNDGYEWELLRYCTKQGINVVGGAGKLLKHFEITINPKSIISYCNRMRSNGNLYRKIGFDLIGKSTPSYYWIKDGKKYSRYSCRKSGAKKILGEKFNDELSVRENFIKEKYYRFWDCGNYVFVKTY